MNSKIGDQAVVLGAGIAGLLAARVLSDHYERVTLVERDQLPLDTRGRRGVPQGRHAHAMMSGGTQILEQLCPNIVREMVIEGAVTAEPLADFRMTVGGHRLRQAPICACAVQASRPFPEGHVRDRVRPLNEVDIIDGCDVVGITADPTKSFVTGVRIMPRGRAPEPR